MPKLNLSERLRDPNSPDGRPRRAAYILPSLFTAGNVFLGYLAIMKSFQASLLYSSGGDGSTAFMHAAICIGVAVFLDGLDGRIARMTNTVSDFGREIDSLADVITFGLAPAILGFAWGLQFIEPPPAQAYDHLRRIGYFLFFLYLLCGAARLARFNIQKNPVPKNPGRPDRKYFVGLPIPAAAGMVAAVVYALNGAPLRSWIEGGAWLALFGLLAFLMVSTWRYASMKDIQLLRPRSPLTLVALGSFIYLIWFYPQPVLLAMAVAYVASGILTRVGGLLRRKPQPVAGEPRHQASS